MESMFAAMHQAQQSAQFAGDQEGRANAPYLAVVTNTDDPLGQRRIKATDPIMPGLETHWLRRLTPRPGLDEPLPRAGSTVLVFSIDGDPINGWWMAAINDTNPPLQKPDPVADMHSIVAGEQSDRIEQDLTVSVGKSLTLINDAGASITLAASGDVIIKDAAGNQISLAGGISFATGSLSVAGSQISTIGALDNAGDVLSTKGWG